MTPEEATAKVNESVPGAKVLRIWRPTISELYRTALVVYVVAPNAHKDEQQEAVFAALRELPLDPGDCYDDKYCRIYASENEARARAVEEFVESALDPIIKKGMNFFLEVKASVNERNVDIRASSPAFKPGESLRALQEKLEDIRPDIREIAPDRRITFHQSDGLGSVPGPTHLHADDDYDDDDDDSPNWPSKTGNPSGKGRDNNPPKR